jgi:hypothetical protein
MIAGMHHSVNSRTVMFGMNQNVAHAEAPRSSGRNKGRLRWRAQCSHATDTILLIALAGHGDGKPALVR